MRIKHYLLFISIFFSFNYCLTAQNSSSTNTAAILEIGKNDCSLDKECTKKLKKTILSNTHFSYAKKISSDKLLLLGDNQDNNFLAEIETIFKDIPFKLSIIQDINANNYNLSELPIYTTQKYEEYQEKLLKWNNRLIHQQSIEKLIEDLNH